MIQLAVLAPRHASAPNARTDNAVSHTRTRRMPRRRISPVVNGLIIRLPTNNAATIAPAAVGDHPNRTWNMMGSRKGTALITAR